MNYVLAVYCLSLAFVRQRRMALLFPVLCFFTPKGFGLIDVASLPYLSVNRAIVLIMVMCFVLYMAAAGFKIRKTHFPLAGSFTLLGVSYLGSLLFNAASWSSDAVTALMLFSEIFFPCYLIWYLCESRGQAEGALKFIYIVGVIVSIYGTLAFVTHFNPYFDYIKQTTPTGRVLAADYSSSVRGARAVGTMSHAITYGAFQAMTFMIGVFLMRSNRSAARLIWFLVAQTVLFVGIVATGSRTPLIFVLLSLLIFTVFARNREKLIVVQIGVVICALGSVVGLEYIERVMDFVLSVFSQTDAASQTGSSLQMRLGQVLVAWKFFSQTPVFGGGVSQTRSILSSGAYPDFYGAESAIFQWAIDLGTVGILAFSALFLQTFSAARRLQDRFSRALVYGMTTGYLVFIVSTGVLETMQFFLIVVVLILIAEGQRDAMGTVQPRSARTANRLPLRGAHQPQ